MRFHSGIVGIAALGLACSSPTTPSSSGSTGSSATTLPSMYAQFNSTVTVTLDGSSVVLKSNGVPDHKSPYFGAGNANYEAPQSGMVVNPNLITSQNLTLRVPVSPAAATPS